MDQQAESQTARELEANERAKSLLENDQKAFTISSSTRILLYILIICILILVGIVSFQKIIF